MTEPEGSSDIEQETVTLTEDIYAFREPTAIGVSFRRSGKVYYFAPNGLSVRQGDDVLAQTEKGVDIGEVVFVRYDRVENEEERQLKPLVRKATSEDLAREAELQLKEREARRICEQRIAEHQLPMRVVAADYTFDGMRLTFFFSAEGRVDFRALVKDLAEAFHTRIELRQIGVRDQAKMIGGLGPCGRPLCCNAWLRNFDPVGIRVAKDQGLSLNPAKISGICDRLMCCLRYEHGTYQELSRKLPKSGQLVSTVKGPAVVKNVVLMHERVTVEYADGKFETISADEVWPEGAEMPEALKQPAISELTEDWDNSGEIETMSSTEEEPAGSKSNRKRRRRKPGRGQAETTPPAVVSPSQETTVRPPRVPRTQREPRPPREIKSASPVETPSTAESADVDPTKRRRRRPRYRSRSKNDKPAQE